MLAITGLSIGLLAGCGKSESISTGEASGREGDPACAEVEAVVKQPFVTAMSLTQTLEPGEDGKINIFSVGSISNSLEAAKKEIVDLEGRITNLEAIEIDSPELILFRDGRVTYLNGVIATMQTSIEELQSINDAFTVLNPEDNSTPDPEAASKAEDVLANAINKELPSNHAELDEKTGLAFSNYSEFLMICPPSPAEG